VLTDVFSTSTEGKLQKNWTCFLVKPTSITKTFSTKLRSTLSKNERKNNSQNLAYDALATTITLYAWILGRIIHLPDDEDSKLSKTHLPLSELRLLTLSAVDQLQQLKK
jgi:hypothetical protein